jgi:hypothetical protein
VLDGSPQHRALRVVNSIGLRVKGPKSPRLHEQRRRRDSTRLLDEFPEQLKDPAQVRVRDFQRCAVIEREADRPPGHRGSIANRYLNRSSSSDALFAKDP